MFSLKNKKICTKCHSKSVIYILKGVWCFLVLSDSLSVVPRTAVLDSRVHDSILFLFIDDDDLLYKTCDSVYDRI